MQCNSSRGSCERAAETPTTLRSGRWSARSECHRQSAESMTTSGNDAIRCRLQLNHLSGVRIASQLRSIQISRDLDTLSDTAGGEISSRECCRMSEYRQSAHAGVRTR